MKIDIYIYIYIHTHIVGYCVTTDVGINQWSVCNGTDVTFYNCRYDRRINFSLDRIQIVNTIFNFPLMAMSELWREPFSVCFWWNHRWISIRSSSGISKSIVGGQVRDAFIRYYWANTATGLSQSNLEFVHSKWYILDYSTNMQLRSWRSSNFIFWRAWYFTRQSPTIRLLELVIVDFMLQTWSVWYHHMGFIASTRRTICLILSLLCMG